MSEAPDFIHLRVHSAYSLSEGAIKINQMVELAKKYNMPAIAIADSGNLFGALEFSVAAAKQGVQPIIAVTISLVDDSVKSLNQEIESGELVLYAANEVGYKNLLKLVSNSYIEGEDCHHPVIAISEFANLTDGLIALTGGGEGLVAKSISAGNLTDAETLLLRLKKLFPDSLYVELQRHEMSHEITSEQGLIDLAYKHGLPLVATNNVMFATPDMYEAHDALICIAEGNYTSEMNRRRFTQQHYFKSQKEMVELFADIPEAIHNTTVIMQRCAVMSEACAPMLPSFPTSEGHSEEEELKSVAYKGLEKRLELYVYTDKMSEEEHAATRKKYFERLDFELSVINRMEFPGYFLIVSDFIRWSNDNNIPVGPGRGSGAGSVVAWALEITGLDPLRYGLLFERFLNPERISMPDFDIDFCQEKRDRVIQYVQDKYGKDRVAQIITFGKLQARAVLRDVGRVLQMPYSQVDRICKMIPFNALAPVTLSQAIEMDLDLQKEQKSDEQVAHLLDIGLKLEGLYRHASTHAAGVVIAKEPLVEILPLYTDHKTPMPTTQYSMKYAEMAGLVKFDFLGLKTLTTIAKAVELIAQDGVTIDINMIEITDKKTYDMLAQGSSTGVFQMESAGMRDALRKMKPDCIEDIIALISLYRPGPMENIPTYIARKHGREKPDYLHPKLEGVLKETFGVIIYQEQVMQIAQILGGYSLGGADLLRRAMGKKIKSEMDKQRVMFENGAVKNGVDKDHASSIFDLVAKFAGYGFNKSHAAAYAIIGYQTAYLKANYPVEFYAASMNIDIGDTDKLNIFKEAAMRSDIEILSPDINKSGAYFTVEKHQGKKAIRYGLAALKNVGTAAMQEMIDERESKGEYADLLDFAVRSDSKIMNKRQLENLARAGAFDSLNNNRKQVFDSANILSRYSQSAAEEKAANQINLFGEPQKSAIALDIMPKTDDWDNDQKITNKYDAIGFYLGSHPLDAYAAQLRKIAVIPSDMLGQAISSSGSKIKLAGMVARIIHRSNAKGKRFAYLYLSDAKGTIEISIFNERLILESREILESNKPLLLVVDAKKDEGGIRLQAEHISYMEDAFNNVCVNMDIIIKEAANMEELTEIINAKTVSNKGRGGARVKFIVTTNDNIKIEISLPEMYNFSQEDSKKLHNAKPVAEVIAY